jgi:hypothetical protein
MFAQQGQDDDRAVARALTTTYSRASARALRRIRALLAAVAVAATALVAFTAATAGDAASAAIVQPKVLTGLTWHPLTLLNGWQSAESSYNTGDPAWAVKNGIVYLSGSLVQPGGGTAATSEFAVLPPAARPAAHRGTLVATYAYEGAQGFVDINADGTMDAWSNPGLPAQQFTSLAGVSYPAATTAAQNLSLVNGWKVDKSGSILDPPGYVMTGGVVRLTGTITQPTGSNPEFAVLPASARPAHLEFIPVRMCASGDATLAVKPNGQMSVTGATARDCSFLAGVSFTATSTAPTILSLINGWQSAQGQDATGDPAYSVTGGVVHLSGSLTQPGAGPLSSDEAAVLPSTVWPVHNVYVTTYAHNGAPGAVEITSNGEVYAYSSNSADAQAFTSLAGISYPVGS